ncbi:hypothetical protein [Brevibacterium album]|uniref:hypothetical protein n=1 Tax=Brevibacterium album TaxID=417948 RepID=UPI0004071A44|nr:hypothetical protein [Brevibacterium album]
MTEANFSFTTKIDGDLFTVRGNSVEEFGANVQAATNSGIGASIKQMVQATNDAAALNTHLDATPANPPQTEAYQPPQQQQQQYQQPQQQAAPPAADSQSPWGQPAGAPMSGQGAWGAPAQAPQGWAQQPSAAGQDAWKHDASIQPPHLQPPMTPFGPAKYKGGIGKNNRPYRMWVDPRPWSQIKNLPKDQQFESVFIRDSDLGI